MYSPCQTVHVDESPQRLRGPDATEKQHGAGVVDAIKHSPLLIHPEGNEVSFVCKLLRQGLGPEAALRDQVGAGVFGQAVGVDSRWVFRREAQAESSTPTALFFSDLERNKDIVQCSFLNTHQRNVLSFLA